MKKIIARLSAATDRILSVARKEAAHSRNEGLGLAADELDLLAHELEEKREEYKKGLRLITNRKPPVRTMSARRIKPTLDNIAASGPMTFGALYTFAATIMERNLYG